MFSRITLIVFTGFWLTMSYLLWRSEYAAQNQVGSSVPVTLVWRKILNAPDPSTLQILHRGRKVGYCRWTSSIGQELASSRMLLDDAPLPETNPSNPGFSRLYLEGNVVFGEDVPGRLKFDCEVRLATNNDWQELNLKVGLKPVTWEIHSLAEEQTVRLQVDEGQGKVTRVFKFSDLMNPQTLLREFDVGSPLGLLGMLALPNRPTGNRPLALGLEWKAHNDWVSIGHTPVRAYRLEAAVLERFRTRIIVSRVGEILRVDLPDGWELVNDQLMSL